MTTPNDPFPPSDFDGWAETYDAAVPATTGFPFTGYNEVLRTIVRLAEPRPGHSVLDLGTGTGNLVVPFAQAGCECWCTDSSEPMLAKARQKLPSARFFLHDLRADLPPELDRKFDHIISAYVFHHFPLDEKIRIIQSLATYHLSPNGRLVIGDIAFPNQEALEKVKTEAGDEWEDEFYWLADEAIPALENAGFKVEFFQISSCAGIFLLQK
ncbi:MAG: class I SAM-dependent methyltransferase [Nitrospirota bacterium]